jgi:hypothetical protein
MELVEDEPGQKRDIGIRIKFGRVVDAGSLARCEQGDVVCYQSKAGPVNVRIAGQEYTALVQGAVLGVLRSAQFPKWVAPPQKTA